MYVLFPSITECPIHLVIKGHLNLSLWFIPIFGDPLKYQIVRGPDGLFYLLMIVLEWLGFFLLKDKAVVNTILPYFCKLTSTQFNCSIQKFWTDNAKDYFNNHLHQFFQQEGIVHKSSCVHTPQQNGVAERKMRHLLNVARSLLHHHNMPKNLWGDAILTATYLINRVLSKILNHQNPFQLLSTHYPNLSLHSPLPLKVFGFVSFVHIPK